MLQPEFVIVASAISMVGAVAYAWDTLHGRNKPNRVTWCLWALAPLVAFAGQMDEGVGWPALMTLAFGVGPAIVVAASFVNKQAYWKMHRLDWVCGALAVVAMVLWLVTQTGLVAIALMLLTDALAGFPTVLKAYREPATETTNAYLLSGISGVITLLTVRDWGFATAAFPLYIVTVATVIYVFIRFPRFLRSPNPG